MLTSLLRNRQILSTSFNKFHNNTTFLNKMAQDSVKKMKLVEPNTIGTHSGLFHCDEVLACYMLSQIKEFENSKIIRTRDNQLLDQCEIVVDVGNTFDSKNLRFDHHQNSFEDTFTTLRPDLGEMGNIRLSSAGLIYVYYGERVIQEILKKQNVTLSKDDSTKLFKKIYQSFIQEIDGIDNGIPMFDQEPQYSINTHLSSRVHSLNPNWMEEKTPDEVDSLFQNAKEYVGKEFVDKVIYYGTVWLPARSIVQNAVKNRFNVSSSGDVIELERPCPWKEHLTEVESELDTEIKYVLFEGGPDDFRIMCVPVKSGSFVLRKPLVKKWFGVRDEELEKVSGIEGITFCHATGFIGGHKTRDGTLKMAELSLAENED